MQIGLPYRTKGASQTVIILYPYEQNQENVIPYLANDAEEEDSDHHDYEGVDKPSKPVHTISETHNLHDFLQTLFLLIHNTCSWDQILLLRNDIFPYVYIKLNFVASSSDLY